MILDDRRTPGFQVSLPPFERNLDELARRVSAHEIPVEELALADITSQISEYLRWRSQDLDEMGTFLATLARLMALKSSALLAGPVAANDGDEDDCRRAPIVGPEHLRGVISNLAGRQGQESFTPVIPPSLVARALEPRSPDLLRRMWHEMQARREKPALRVAVPSFVRLETAMSNLIRRLRSGASISLHGVLGGATREEAVVHFLAVLELVRRRQAQAVQHELFGDITVEQRERTRERAERVG